MQVWVVVQPIYSHQCRLNQAKDNQKASLNRSFQELKQNQSEADKYARLRTLWNLNVSQPAQCGKVDSGLNRKHNKPSVTLDGQPASKVDQQAYAR